jgi:2-polyprenyl-3-methyl-5-hydroxy-6-metoxy-1,4-benzoquinol methylase
MRPYVDFYRANNISPVRQDISNLRKHFERREALYRHLSIAPGLVSGHSVIEFGPGSGHNAIYTTSLEPKRYVLVDANEVGLQDVKRTLQSYGGAVTAHEVHSSLIEEYRSGEQFDLVLCEGVIPFQVDPRRFVRHVGKFVRPGGLLVVTTIDGVSFLGESTRRLIASRLTEFKAPAPERLKVLAPFFKPHLATLKGMSRSVEDWIYDNILIPYTGRLFSIADAIAALDESFDIYGTSPSFLTDWRWYKEIHGEQRRAYNQRAVDQYLRNVTTLIDYRVEIPPMPLKTGKRTLALAEKIFYSMVAMENSGSTEKSRGIIDGLREIAALVKPASKATAAALAEAAAFLQKPLSKKRPPSLRSFRSFFGRGQQYVSFIRRS